MLKRSAWKAHGKEVASMKRYDTPKLTVKSFNKEEILTNNASMAALQEWSPANELTTTTRMVDYKDAIKLIF